MTAVCNRILPQDDRDDPHKIPVVNYIDERLYVDRLDGYRFEGMPSDQEAHRLGLQGISEVARHMFSRRFVDLSPLDQESVLKTVHDGNPPAGHEVWRRMPVERFWVLLVQDVVGAYYCAPLRLGRNWIRWAGISAGLHAPGERRTRTLGRK